MEVLVNSIGQVLATSNIIEEKDYFIVNGIQHLKYDLCIVAAPENTIVGDIIKDGKILKNIILKSELLSRLTEQELENIVNFEEIITDAEKLKLMRKVMFKFNNYQEIDLGHPDTTNFANAIVYCGLITAERIKEIIGA